MNNKSAIVIGAGIVGLAVARALAVKKYEVTVFEKNTKPAGASVSNFGMIWPVGQPLGSLYDRAMYSRNVWKKICQEAKIWHNEKGSLQLAYGEEELAVVEEFYETNFYERDIELLNRKNILTRFNGIAYNNLRGGVYSTSELIIDPREAISKLSAYLSEKWNTKFLFNTCINRIEGNKVFSGKKHWEADKIFVCSGQDFETLYPEIFAKSGITKCKLQMMRTVPQKDKWEIGASLAGGLTLLRYDAFANCASLPALREKMENELPEYIKYGIHVMVSQNGLHEFTIGDTHEYGLTHDPFDRKHLNDLVLNYLKTFVKIKDLKIAQTWNGIYAKLPGKTEFINAPTEYTTIVNGLSGAGMTLSFGLADKLISKL